MYVKMKFFYNQSRFLLPEKPIVSYLNITPPWAKYAITPATPKGCVMSYVLPSLNDFITINNIPRPPFLTTSDVSWMHAIATTKCQLINVGLQCLTRV